MVQREVKIGIVGLGRLGKIHATKSSHEDSTC